MLPRHEIVRQISAVYEQNRQLKAILIMCHPEHEDPKVCEACRLLERDAPQVCTQAFDEVGYEDRRVESSGGLGVGMTDKIKKGY